MTVKLSNYLYYCFKILLRTPSARKVIFSRWNWIYKYIKQRQRQLKPDVQGLHLVNVDTFCQMTEFIYYFYLNGGPDNS